MIRIIGSYVSPYVRKVLACLNLKGLAYEIDPITPFYGNDEFERLSPLRRIPVLIDGDLTRQRFLGRSAPISTRPIPGAALLPADPKDRARARWLEEYADTRLGDLFIWGLFYQKIVHPMVWGEPGDQARIDKTLTEDIPAALDYLEGRASRLRLPVRRASASPTSRSPPSSATAPMPGSSADPAALAADRGVRRAHPRAPCIRRACCRSRTSSAAPRSSAGARPCSTPARR